MKTTVYKIIDRGNRGGFAILDSTQEINDIPIPAVRGYNIKYIIQNSAVFEINHAALTPVTEITELKGLIILEQAKASSLSDACTAHRLNAVDLVSFADRSSSSVELIGKIASRIDFDSNKGESNTWCTSLSSPTPLLSLTNDSFDSVAAAGSASAATAVVLEEEKDWSNAESTPLQDESLVVGDSAAAESQG